MHDPAALLGSEKQPITLPVRRDMSAQLGQRALRVLVVDDHQLFRTGLRELLAEEGFEVEAVGGGEQALRRVPSCAPDVVLMDVDMPAMSGIEATRRLRETAPTARVLMLTVFPADDLVLQAVRAGASGYLLKDAELGQIVAGIRHVAAGHCMLSPRAARAVIDQVRVTHEAEAVPAAPQTHDLSPRELEVLALMARGCDNPEIGRRLFVSPSTVKNHVSRVLEKLAVENRVQAAIYAVRHRLVEDTALSG
jgi:DNA-binding NarL/FixJ family response regulator